MSINSGQRVQTQPAGAGGCTSKNVGARGGPIQMTWLRIYHFLASLGFLGISNDKAQWSGSLSFIENIQEGRKKRESLDETRGKD